MISWERKQILHLERHATKVAKIEIIGTNAAPSHPGQMSAPLKQVYSRSYSRSFIFNSPIKTFTVSLLPDDFRMQFFSRWKVLSTNLSIHFIFKLPGKQIPLDLCRPSNQSRTAVVTAAGATAEKPGASKICMSALAAQRNSQRSTVHA